MKRRLWTIGLVSIGLLLASCGTPNPRPLEDASVATASPTEAQSPTATLTDSPPTAAPSPTQAAVTSAGAVRRISPLEARVLVDGGRAVLYDTRSAQSYGSEHAAGAISFPESQASRRIGELATDKALIFY